MHGSGAWLEVAQLHERAQAVMARSRALVQEARALRCALVGLAALRSRPLPASSSGR
jgi:hypothetical protein